MMNELRSFENHTMDVDSILSLDEDISLPNNESAVYSNTSTAMLPLTTGITQISPYGAHDEVVCSIFLLVHSHIIKCVSKTKLFY